MAENPITLELLAAQQQRILDELGSIRTELAMVRARFVGMQEDIRVLSAMAARQDAANKTMLDLLQTLTDQMGRFDTRLRRIEETQQA